MKTFRSVCFISAALALLASGGAYASHDGWSAWSVAAPVVEVNSPRSSDGCPIESRDGLSLYIASRRSRIAGRQRHLGRGSGEQERALRRAEESRCAGQLRLRTTSVRPQSTAATCCSSRNGPGAGDLRRGTGTWRHVPEPPQPRVRVG